MERFIDYKGFKSYLAEFAGSFMFIFVAVSSTAASALAESTSALEEFMIIGVTTATILGVAIFIFGPYSGGHFNPAVSVMFAFIGKLPLNKVFGYVVAQLLGATLAGYLTNLIFPASIEPFGLHKISPLINLWQGFTIEFLLTILLVSTILFVVVVKNEKSVGKIALTVGFVLLTIHLVALPFTGAGVNPARSFAPAIAFFEWQDHWLYWIAPLTAAVVVGSIYRFIYIPLRSK